MGSNVVESSSGSAARWTIFWREGLLRKSDRGRRRRHRSTTSPGPAASAFPPRSRRSRARTSPVGPSAPRCSSTTSPPARSPCAPARPSLRLPRDARGVGRADDPDGATRDGAALAASEVNELFVGALDHVSHVTTEVSQVPLDGVTALLDAAATARSIPTILDVDVPPSIGGGGGGSCGHVVRRARRQELPTVLKTTRTAARRVAGLRGHRTRRGGSSASTASPSRLTPGLLTSEPLIAVTAAREAARSPSRASRRCRRRRRASPPIRSTNEVFGLVLVLVLVGSR